MIAGHGDGRHTDRFVSTGRLPAQDRVGAFVREAHERFRSNDEGAPSGVYPALASVPAELFGISLVGVDGSTAEAGDVDVEFALMSVAKPFVFALVCQDMGAQASRARIGVNATGKPFDSLEAIENGESGRTNPMVNAGAIVTTSLLPGSTPDEQWAIALDGLSRFVGRHLELSDAMYASVSATNHRNRDLARMLRSHGQLGTAPDVALDLYTRQSCLSVTAHDLAVMGATLADGGLNPMTGEQVVDAEACRAALAVMVTAGLYERSGDWVFTVGLPAKSAIGGGIVTAVPGKGGLGTYAPPLDDAGNSIKGQLAAGFLSERLGLDLLASSPSGTERG